MKRLAFVLLLLAAPAFADTPEPVKTADGPTVTVPAEIKVKAGAWFSISGETTGGPIAWLIPDTALRFEPALNKLFQDRGENIRILIAPDTAGVYRVWAGAAGPIKVGETTQSVVGKFSETRVIVGEPPPPVPPGPTPPGPVPPGPVPIPGDGLRVLIVYESAELSKLPKEQLLVFYGQAVRGYLDSHCVKGPDGKTAEWRIWDQNVPTGAESPTWQAAMQVKRDKLPWLVVSTGKTGFSGPLPADETEALKLLKTFGGN